MIVNKFFKEHSNRTFFVESHGIENGAGFLKKCVVDCDLHLSHCGYPTGRKTPSFMAGI